MIAAVTHLPARALRSAHQPIAPRALLDDGLGLVCSGVLDDARCAAIVGAVYAARGSWTASWNGLQHCLGRAYYTHLEEGMEHMYFAAAARSNALVERVAPGLTATLLDLLSATIGATVELRPGWCGPGMHVFPAGGHAAQHGGEVHCDLEGLTADQRARRTGAITLVLGLQPAERGGGTRLWSARFDGNAEPLAAGEPTTVHLRGGDALLFDSYRLHQIEPFDGALDRLTATVHAVEVAPMRWEAWF
jgi:hypothetical protein